MAEPITHRLCDIGERAWLRRVRRWFAADNAAAGLTISIGDDAAALQWPTFKNKAENQLVVSTDSLIEGVHFRRDWISPRHLGAKSLAVNVSDLAAMAAQPVACFLALSVPPETPLADLQDFFLGFRAASRRWGCPLAGGDMTRAPQWCITVTVLGRPGSAGRLARRDAAQPGMNLYVTGDPGESGAGLYALTHGLDSPAARAVIRRHNAPVPRLREATILAKMCPDLTMLDVSDGLWNDAAQLAEASSVRVTLDLTQCPASGAMRTLAAQLGEHGQAENWQLFGGEDYELLFATRADLASLQNAFRHAGIKTAIRPIGTIEAGRNVWLLDPTTGARARPTDLTFRHF